MIKKTLIKFVEWLHLKLFGHEISQEMKVFIVNLFWSIFGGGLAAAIVLAVNIFAGRFMGPVEYGKYNLVLVIASYFFVPIYFGLDLASVRAIAKSHDDKEIKQNISSPAVFVLLSTIVVLGLVFIFKKPVSALFSTNVSLIKFAIFFTVFLVAKNIFDCFIRGIKQFKYQFLGKLTETAIILIGFVVLFIILKRDVYSSYLFTLAVGAFAIIIFYFFKLKGYLGHFNLNKLKGQLSYGKFFVLTATLGTIFISLDRLMINKYLTAYDLGLYGAYYTASVTFVTQITQMFNNVFFPSIAKNMNRAVFSKIERLLKLSFIPLLAIVTAIVFVMMKLFGSKYGIYLDYIIIFGILGTTQIIIIIYYSVILTFSKSVYKKYLWYSNAINLSTVIIYVLLVAFKVISIKYIALALILNYILIITLQRKLIKGSFCANVDANEENK